MGLAKKTTETLPAGTRDFRVSNSENIGNPQPESGAAAAVERLKKAKAEPEAKPTYKPRDFDAEARGKTRCVQFEAALMSPAIAGMKFDTMEQYLALVKQAAEAGVKYTFGE